MACNGFFSTPAPRFYRKEIVFGRGAGSRTGANWKTEKTGAEPVGILTRARISCGLRHDLPCPLASYLFNRRAWYRCELFETQDTGPRELANTVAHDRRARASSVRRFCLHVADPGRNASGPGRAIQEHEAEPEDNSGPYGFAVLLRVAHDGELNRPHGDAQRRRWP